MGKQDCGKTYYLVEVESEIPIKDLVRVSVLRIRYYRSEISLLQILVAYY